MARSLISELVSRQVKVYDGSVAEPAALAEPVAARETFRPFPPSRPTLPYREASCPHPRSAAVLCGTRRRRPDRPRSSGAARVAAKTMRLLAGLGGALLLAVVLWDAFETIILPRRANRRLPLPRAFYGATRAPWAASARLVRAGNRRELFLLLHGPLSLVLLLALWAAGVVTGFGLLPDAKGAAGHAPRQQGPGLAL